MQGAALKEHGTSKQPLDSSEGLLNPLQAAAAVQPAASAGRAE